MSFITLLPEPALLVGVEEGVHQIIAIVLWYLEGLGLDALVKTLQRTGKENFIIQMSEHARVFLALALYSFWKSLIWGHEESKSTRARTLWGSSGRGRGDKLPHLNWAILWNSLLILHARAAPFYSVILLMNVHVQENIKMQENLMKKPPWRYSLEIIMFLIYI